MKQSQVVGMAVSKHIMPLSFLAHMANDGSELLVPTLLPVIARDFSLSYSQIGVLGGAMIIAIGLGQTFVGYLSDLTGRRITFVSFGLCLLSVGLVGISASNSYEQLIFFNLIAGLGCSVYHPVGVSTISEMFKDDGKGRALGIHGSGGNIGMCIVPLVSGVLADYFGWRTVFWLFPVFALAIAFLFSATLRDRKVKSEKLRFRKILSRRLLIISVSLGFISMAARGMSVFFPMRLSSMQYSSSYVGFLFALLFGSGIFGQYVGGCFSDKHSKRAMIAYLSLASSVLLFVSFFIQNLFALAILMVIAGFAKDAIWPPFFSLSTENVSRKSYGTTLGVFFSVGFIMSSQAPVIMGIVWDHFSFLTSVSLLLIFGFVAALTVRHV